MSAKCELCGEPMPQGEEMFKFHGYSGPCPKPPLVDRITNPSELIVNCINILRNEEGSSVEILCENPDGEPSNVVIVCDDWTSWEERRFGGNTLLDALQSAVSARKLAKNKS